MILSKKVYLLLPMCLLLSGTVHAQDNSKYLCPNTFSPSKEFSADSRILRLDINESKFSILGFNDFFQGVVIAIAYSALMRGPNDGNWTKADRVWMNSDWGSDVHSLCWNSADNTILVLTDGVYGTNSLYRLMPIEKKATRVELGAKIESLPVIEKNLSIGACAVAPNKTCLTVTNQSGIVIAVIDVDGN